MAPRTWFRTVALFAVVAIVNTIALNSQPDAQAREEAKGKKYALLVGVNKYQSSKFTELKYTENDVEKLADLLRDKDAGGFTEVRVLTGTRGKDDTPTAANFRTALKGLIKGKSSSDTVLIALSGHGLELEVEDQEKNESKKGKPRTYAYFCPHDADLADKVSYSTGHSDSLIHIKEILDAMDNCGAGAKLLLMDACRNEMKAEVATRDLDVGKFTIPKDSAALFSCKSGQKAFETKKLEHGVFFHFVLKGLKGEAGKNKRGQVTWDTLVTYVKEHVTDEVPNIIGDGARQHPHAVSNLSGNSPTLARAGKPKTLLVKDKTSSFEMEFVLIPATGKDGFTMGSTKAEQDAAIADYEKDFGKADNSTIELYRAEGPQHKVVISKEFYMGKFEVTQGQWKALTNGNNPSYFCKDGGGKDSVKGLDTDRFPVECVSWKDTEGFLNALEKLPAVKEKNLKFRLPTEAEWEYACRGGVAFQEPFNFDGKPSKSISHTDANFDSIRPFGGGKEGTPLKRTCEIEKYKANSFGLHDMHGNVYEWCLDAYDAKAYEFKVRTDPSVSKEEGVDRVFRGGSWFVDGRHCRATNRHRLGPLERYSSVGFRVAAIPHE